MSDRQPLNAAFLQSQFLDGANAAYIEQMQEQWERNPGSVATEWRRFFESVQDQDARTATAHHRANAIAGLDDRDMLGALGADYTSSRRRDPRRRSQAARPTGRLRPDADRQLPRDAGLASAP